MMIATDAGRRSKRYANMANRLVQIDKMLPGIQTACSLRHTVAESEEIMLDELIEWHAASREAGH